MPTQLRSASLVDNVQFNQTVIIPNAVQGLFRRRPGPVGVATRIDVDGRVVRLLSGLRKRYGPGPLWVRVMTNPALLLLSVEDVRLALEGSPHPFASDPEAKRKGMGHFQPDALTISRGDLWADRRRFVEAVLDTTEPVHHLGDTFLGVIAEETATLLEELDSAGGTMTYDDLHRAFRRIVRRIVLGDSARDDEELSGLQSTLMGEANKMPSAHSGSFEPYRQRIRAYVDATEKGSLVGLFGEAPTTPDTKPDGQVPHFLFAMQDTLSANLLRALALVATHPAQAALLDSELSALGSPPFSAAQVGGLGYARGCIQEAMRLWPTTPLLSREVLTDITWNGAVVPARTQVLFSNVFFHRDAERLAYADRFAPEEWTEGEAAQDWGLNFFSHGPQGCPGAYLALFVGAAVLAHLLSARTLSTDAKLDPDKPLPHMLNTFGVKLALTPR